MVYRKMAADGGNYGPKKESPDHVEGIKMEDEDEDEDEDRLDVVGIDDSRRELPGTKGKLFKKSSLKSGDPIQVY